MSPLRRYRPAAIRAVGVGFLLGALVVLVPALLGGGVGGGLVRGVLVFGLTGAGIVVTGVVGAAVAIAATVARPDARRPRRAGIGAAIGISTPGLAIILTLLARGAAEAVWGVLPLTVLAAAVSAVLAANAVEAADGAAVTARAAAGQGRLDSAAGDGATTAAERG